MWMKFQPISERLGSQFHGMTSSQRFWARIASPRNPWFWLIGAVIATIVGDSVFQILTLEYREWTTRYLIFRLALLALTTLGIFWLVPLVAHYWLERRKGQPDISNRLSIPSPRALIVYVSSNKTGPYRVAVDRFVRGDETDEKRLRKVLLIHSPESQEVAKDFQIELEGNRRLDAEKDGLLANFSDLRSTYDVTRIAIERTLREYSASDIVVDVTGGSGICTAGAVLASMESGVPLSYIKMKPGRKLEDGDMVSVDVGWVNVERSVLTSQEVPDPAHGAGGETNPEMSESVETT